ncbi:MAG TPA: hypothetical protein VIK27_12985 [Candidatus Aquilonibacter sp.]
MSTFDLLLLAWVAALIGTGIFLVRRQWPSARWWAGASVIFSILIVILKPK